MGFLEISKFIIRLDKIKMIIKDFKNLRIW